AAEPPPGVLPVGSGPLPLPLFHLVSLTPGDVGAAPLTTPTEQSRPRQRHAQGWDDRGGSLVRCAICDHLFGLPPGSNFPAWWSMTTPGIAASMPAAALARGLAGAPFRRVLGSRTSPCRRSCPLSS